MYDIVYIQLKNYDNDGWAHLKQCFPLAKRAQTFKEAQEIALTDFFWAVYNDQDVSNFEFDYIPCNWHSEYIHSFKNAGLSGEVFLVPKNANVTDNEIDNRFFINQIEIATEASISRLFDVVFISYEEPNADENYSKLLQIVPHAMRVHGVKGIHNAHIQAAKLCRTSMLWVVDADARIVDDFKFDFQVGKWDQDVVHVWRSQNPINGLEYGYGGIKLLPTQLTINMDISKPDMTTSISSKFRPMQEISNITGFNTDPYNTWKSAFRECVKLSSKIIDRQKDDETHVRLHTWCTVGADQLFGKYALDGAKQGTKYGKKYQTDFDELKKINNFTWLREKFNEQYN
jgi:hypothetical protein